MTRSYGMSRLLMLLALGVWTTVPLVVLVLQSLARPWFFPDVLPDALTVSAWSGVVTGELRNALGRSLGIAIAVGVIAAPVAATVGRAISRLRGRPLHVATALAFLPVAAPPIALATGLQFFMLRAGVGGTVLGVLLSHLVPAAGYLTLYFLGVFRVYDDRVEEAATTLGASRWQTIVRVRLALLRRPLAEAAVLGFLVSWSQYALTLVLGGGAVLTLPLMVQALVRAGQDQEAAVGALVLIVPPTLAIAALGLAARRTTVVAA